MLAKTHRPHMHSFPLSLSAKTLAFGGKNILNYSFSLSCFAGLSLSVR